MRHFPFQARKLSPPTAETMNSSLPDIDRCLQLMDEFSMWENIRRHSFMVARVAELLQRSLVKDGKATDIPDRDLVIAGALLHDIAKSKCLEENCRHADVGAILCTELGYPQIGEIVQNHVFLSNFRHESYMTGKFNAMELVFYADKRVRHDEVVTLDARLEYIIGKYGDSNPLRETLIEKNFLKCREFESHLFSFIAFTPDDVPALLAEVPGELLHYPPQATA